MTSITFKIDDSDYNSSSQNEDIENIKENIIEYVKPTICFATMCKNEEECIKDTLESVYKYIDYWIVCDTGSTDKTCEIVTEFFKEKNIPGELFHHEWIEFDVNKTKMYEECYNKTDYVLHLDADDHIVGNFDFEKLFESKEKDADGFYFNLKRGKLRWNATILYKNNLRWKICGVAHNIITCADKNNVVFSDYFVRPDVWIDAEERGVRKYDQNKYLKDAEKLKKQFFDTLYDDPDGLNNRSVFYTAQSYLDSGNPSEALKWYSLYTKLKYTWIEEVFESYIRISLCLITLNRPYSDIEKNINKAIDIFDDRAEPYYIFGVYNNQQKKWENGYKLLEKALSMDYTNVKKKYKLFIQIEKYGKFVKDELSVSCFWTNRLEEGKKYLLEIINDNDFQIHKERLNTNMKHFNDRLAIYNV